MEAGQSERLVTRRSRLPLCDTTGHVGLAGDDVERQLDRRAVRALLLDAYTVAATVNNVACRVEVADAGQGCAGRRRGRLRRSGDLAESGRGFAIMRACVDEVTLRSAPGQGTRVVLDKRIAWGAPLSRTA